LLQGSYFLNLSISFLGEKQKKKRNGDIKHSGGQSSSTAKMSKIDPIVCEGKQLSS